MKNKAINLNDYLFEQIEKLNDETLSSEYLELTIKKAEAISSIADTIIKNNETQLKAAKIAVDSGLMTPKQLLPLISDKQIGECNG